VSTPGTTARHEDLAATALNCAIPDPRRAERLAGEALKSLGARGDAHARSVAEHALGLDRRTVGDLDGAVTQLARAVRLGDRSADSGRAAQSRLSLAGALAMAGRGGAALAALDVARAALRGTERARAEVQRAGVLALLGRHDEALDGFRRALPALRASGDAVWEARALSQRGLVLVERGDLGRAERDLARAEELFGGAGPDAAGARHNRGWVAACAGDVPRALAHYDAAEAMFAAVDVPVSELPLDRARLLLSVGLADEAREVAERAGGALATGGAHAYRAEALVVAASALLASGDAVAARERAEQAAAMFRRQHRTAWCAVADDVALRARHAAGERSPSLVRAALRTAEALRHNGLPGPALHAGLLAGVVRQDLADPRAAETLAAAAAARRGRRSADQRAQGWYAAALLREAAGDDAGALAAARAGLRVLEEHAASLGATELRASASVRGRDLATVGQRVALRGGGAARVFEWAERWRATALRLPLVRPPDDPTLAALLAELRAVTAEAEEAALDGRANAPLLRRQAAVEDDVRRVTRRSEGSKTVAAQRIRLRDIAAALGERAFVEYARIGPRTVAVSLVDGRARLADVGPAGEVDRAVEAARFALRRLAHGRGSRRSLAAARELLDRAAWTLDALLLGPVPEVDDRPLVVVPPAELHALPWGAMPSCRGRAVAVSPSAAVWLAAATAPPHGDSTVLVAGPGLPGADAEVAALQRLWPGATALRGDAATATAVLEHLDGARLAHVAAHGWFRSDNPLFSSIGLHDGHLTVYDVQRLARAPYRLVLSACDSGLSATRPGDELLGLAAATFPLGTAGLVASSVAVPDEPTARLMVALHEALRDGAALPVALARATAALDRDEPGDAATAAAFVAIGAA
jgi:CHAT domain-containing protein/tetratricopeptide (TPR) repeat protein